MELASKYASSGHLREDNDYEHLVGGKDDTRGSPWGSVSINHSRKLAEAEMQ